jgi:hypothetical protein
MDDIKEKRSYWKLKEEAIHHILCIIHLGRGFETVVRQIKE